MSLRQRNVPSGEKSTSSATPISLPSTPISSSSTESSETKSKSELYFNRNRKSKRYLNIAPLNIPMSRRLETIGIIWHTVSIPFFFTLCLFLVYLGWVSWLLIILPYFIWWYGFDLHTPTNGKANYRVRNWVKNLIVWEWFVNYFPIRVHKSCEFEPTFSEVVEDEDNLDDDDEEDLINENSTTIRLNKVDNVKYRTVSNGPRYVFGYHPHGVISMGVMGLFATNILRNEAFEPPARFLRFLFYDPSKHKPLLPNIGNIFPLTLNTQFTLPFYRDYLLSLGLTSASAVNIKSLINNGDNSVCIVVGGAQESLLNSGNNERNVSKEIKLVLNKRKGFVKLAIELGNISLVPIFGFGEADIYNIIQPKPGTIGDTFQKWLKKNFSFTLPFFSARGIFIYDFGFLPYRNPINVCIGRPIYVPPNLRSKVPQELLDHYHKLYVDELKRVFEENKCKFGYENVVLNIVE
ncbi:DAGAT-domain-containing protein [Yamadazyma tenuis ATCC 10573]|uniref:Diacylglycerol O-acyltransferase n=1 Tax=Candida tenuis (strain ATCC 10573 / BCRC 21748 / CBS 615 / JCM 9827 / NBRC 10315 / NRRL Y-1498 / VKM Y-70) TaxID=590646 RepID=G3BDW0_CANTC|nr:DAGAT-domain-containing protein [Yamadazyma tenuis ATCC 10573]EGV60396.1 DAGAT-domain-containing protein [Yamadazyma tenuis ATCC 10573]